MADYDEKYHDLRGTMIDESFIARHFVPDVQDDVLQALHDAVLACREACERSLDYKRAMEKDEKYSSAFKTKQVHETSWKHLIAASRKIDASRALAEAAIKKLDDETGAPPAPRDAHKIAMAGEIRMALIRMSHGDRAAAIERAINTGIDEIVSAIVSAPSLLTGLTDDEREMHRHAWRAKHYPQELDRLNRIRKAVRDSEIIAGLTRKYIDGLTGAPTVETSMASEKATD
jgi:hypothetical protein